MHPNETIRLGAKSWTLRPLTCRQVEQIETLVLQASTANNMTRSMQVIAAALSRDHSEDAAGLWDVEATRKEIDAASAAILRMGGWIERESAAGEAEAPTTGAAPGLGSAAA